MAEDNERKEKPTLAVALKYERTRDPAPRVVAKGKGAIAEQIVRVAEEHGIVVREDANLVDILAQLDIDTVIPLEAYAAVAEILNYVYKTNAQVKAGKQDGGT